MTMNSKTFPRRTSAIAQNKGRKTSFFEAMNTLSTVTDWYRANHFRNEDEARGAFELAWQQYMDGCGLSAAQWLGMTAEELDGWVRNGTLPPKKAPKAAKAAKPTAPSSRSLPSP